MKPNKIVRAFYRRFNTSASAKGKAKCLQSLCHLLRVPMKEGKKLEWLDEFADENLLWRPSVGLTKLNMLSYDQKMTLIEEVSAPTLVKGKAKKQKQRRQYKAKIKKAIASERAQGNGFAASLLGMVLITPNNKQVNGSILKVFKRLKMKRQQQRIKMLETYIHAHDSLIPGKRSPNIFGLIMNQLQR